MNISLIIVMLSSNTAHIQGLTQQERFSFFKHSCESYLKLFFFH